MPPSRTATDGSVAQVLHRARGAATDDRVSVAGVIDALGPAAHSAVMVLTALIIVSPASGIPFLSSTGGTIIALTAVQIVLGRGGLWLPAWVRRRTLPSARFRTALEWLDRPARFIDRHTRPRWRLLLRRPGRIAVAGLCAVCGLAMPVLEIVPFSSSILAAAVLPLAVSLVVRDGALAVAGLVLLGGGLGFGGWVLLA